MNEEEYFIEDYVDYLTDEEIQDRKDKFENEMMIQDIRDTR